MYASSHIVHWRTQANKKKTQRTGHVSNVLANFGNLPSTQKRCALSAVPDHIDHPLCGKVCPHTGCDALIGMSSPLNLE